MVSATAPAGLSFDKAALRAAKSAPLRDSSLLDGSVETLKQIGPRRTEALRNVGITTVRDFIHTSEANLQSALLQSGLKLREAVAIATLHSQSAASVRTALNGAVAALENSGIRRSLETLKNAWGQATTQGPRNIYGAQQVQIEKLSLASVRGIGKKTAAMVAELTGLKTIGDLIAFPGDAKRLEEILRSGTKPEQGTSVNELLSASQVAAVLSASTVFAPLVR